MLPNNYGGRYVVSMWAPLLSFMAALGFLADFLCAAPVAVVCGIWALGNLDCLCWPIASRQAGGWATGGDSAEP